MDIRLDGKVAIVTGGSRGIGKAIAKVYADSGAQVMITSRNEDSCAATAEELGDSVAYVAGHIARDEDAERVIEATMDQFGRVDILVNNAGGSPDGMWPMPFLETPRESWPKFIGMNLDGVINCTHHVLGSMAERGWGRVVSVSSDAARTGSHGSSIYGAAKAGGEGLMRTLSKEYGPKGVTTNSVVLGLIDTVPKEFLESMDVGAAYPMRRVGTAKDVAAGVVYLTSEEAGWVTGHSLVINGGGTG